MDKKTLQNVRQEAGQDSKRQHIHIKTEKSLSISMLACIASRNVLAVDHWRDMGSISGFDWILLWSNDNPTHLQY